MKEQEVLKLFKDWGIKMIKERRGGVKEDEKKAVKEERPPPYAPLYDLAATKQLPLVDAQLHVTGKVTLEEDQDEGEAEKRRMKYWYKDGREPVGERSLRGGIDSPTRMGEDTMNYHSKEGSYLDQYEEKRGEKETPTKLFGKSPKE